MSAVRIVESSGSLGALQISDGSGGFVSGSLTAGSNVTITDAGNGSFTIAASTTGGSTIGTAGDSDYSDGLFTDFTTNTTIGDAIDRFNEVLKALAPAPAPDLDDIDSLNTGLGPLSMSFGSSNNQSSATPAYISVGGSAGISAAVDVNGSYAVVTSSNNIRLGIFNGTTHISGVLNPDVSSNSQGNSIQNYPNFSFGDGDSGTLYLDINGTGSFSINLTSALIGSGTSGLGTGSYSDHNGSGFNFFSTPATGTFSNGNSFNSFKHRTGQYVVAASSQRRGWNYARVRHVIGDSTKTTNYIEWVNDDNNDALAAAGNSLTYEGSGSIHLSGIEYFRSGSAIYKVRASNVYKYIFDGNDISFTTSKSGTRSNVTFTIPDQGKPLIGGSEDHTKVLHITGSTNVTADYLLGGSITAGVNVSHPRKSNLSNAGQSTESNILQYNLTDNSDEQTETFRGESFRIVSGAYDTQSSLAHNSNKWDSQVYMTASNGGHSNGLQFYRDRLYSPLSTLNSGNFSSISNGPSDNPNYSSQSGQRTFYRWFKNETGSTKYDLTIAINGSGTIVSAATGLSTANIRVFVKFPSDGTRETGWLDLATEFVLDSYADNNGAHTANGSLSFDSSLNATNYVTLGTVGIGDDEYIGLRIEAGTQWTGYIDDITVTFGAGTGTIAAIPNLDDIDCNVDGTDCNLSFGSSKTISGYTSVGTAAGFSAVDINGLYETDSNSNNLRRSVFAKDTHIIGDLNEDVSVNNNGSHKNHVENSFSDANSGSLKLEVNGSFVHAVEITGSYNLVGSGVPGSGGGSSVNSNGSGFTNLSTWEAAEYDNGVPDYTEIYRTGRYKVHTADQRNGWNYARVVHTVAGSDRETNYVEWVNDPDANALSISGLTLKPFEDDNLFHLSGVKYFTQPSGSIEVRVSNLYRNVYSDSNSALSFANLANATGIKLIQAGSGLASTKTTSAAIASLQNLATSADSEQQSCDVTGSIRFSLTGSLSGSYANYTRHSATGSLVFDHPLKTNLDTHSTLIMTSSVLLVYSSSDSSNVNTTENFTGEAFRIQNSTYGSQANVTSTTYNWSSTGSINDSNLSGYYDGLLLFDKKLISPLDAGKSGDFRNYSDGGVFDGPSSNVNYSSLNQTTRTYLRGFLNNTTNDLGRITIVLYGDATIIGKSSSLGSNKNIYVEMKLPGKSGWLDLGTGTPGAGNVSDGDGCRYGDGDASIDLSGATNVCTFNGVTVDGTVSGAEYFVIKLSAHKNWTGYISQISVTWSG